MGTFAVIWWSTGQPPRPGKLEVAAGGARFCGRGGEPLSFALEEVVEAAIARTGGRPTLVVRLRDGREVFVRDVVGIAVLHELADALAPTHPQAA